MKAKGEKDGVASDKIGKRITEARLAAGYRRVREFSQAELAETIGVSPPTVGRWERGVKKPDPATIERICAALAADPGWVTYGPPRTGVYAGAMTVDVAPTAATREGGGGSVRPPRGRRPASRGRSAPFPPAWYWGDDALADTSDARTRLGA